MSTNPILDGLPGRDPRGWTEEEWLDVFELLLARLRAATNAEIEVGEYWLLLGMGSATASLCARIRADGPLLSTASDCWEAAFCITGGSDGTYADVMAFPFCRGSVVTRSGRMQDLGGDHHVDEFWLQYAGGRWMDRGWRYPACADEWSHVLTPGEAFFRSLRCTVARPALPEFAPVVITVDHGEPEGPSLGGAAAFSIHRLVRNQQEIVSAPATAPLARPGNSRRRASDIATRPASFRLDSLAIPGGWAPGHYQLEIRLDHAPTSAIRDSHISAPVDFEVLAS